MLIDLLPRLDEPAVRDLLAAAAGDPASAKLEALAAEYRSGPGRHLLGVDHGRGLEGCIGIALGAEGAAVIRHIAVAPVARRHGLGRMLIESAVTLYALTGLTAETDRDAVEFYARCGFAVTSLGEVYPGAERFRCALALPRQGTHRERAAALIAGAGRVVLLHRWNYGREYYVLPGGGIKRGETPEEACVREAREETSLAVTLVRPLGVLVNLGRVEHYFLATCQGGRLRLGEPERSHQTPNNRYVPEWLEAEQLTRINFLPAGEREFFYAAARD